ncbi:peroxidase 29 [Phtheirospermum japonicum]|uniref:Peroxidase n=1 Tax=Phtheirospermum japonicum TaxID=374723 RepID=A0A830D6U7_9LAMI|nr:peroxidase 29 [Phtheirospermum japonicum]
MDVMKMMSAVILVVLLSCGGEASISYNFYDKVCPQLDHIVRAGVQSASLGDPTTPSALLRLMFHDCQVQGCDASILLEPDGDMTKFSEMASSRNFGIRKRDFINLIKSAVEGVCPQMVSCSDIIVMAAREAVALSGGPRINVPLGRRDSSNPPNFTLASVSLPWPDIGVDAMLRVFAKHAMSIQESVAILGAHTLGITHCSNLESRLYKQQSRPGNEIINPVFQNALRLKCPGVGPTGFVQNDFTSVLFDNQYFVNSINGLGVLKIDAQMPLDSRTRPFVEKFASDENAFFDAFSSAFVKLSRSNVLTGNQGVIRRNCNGLY